MVNHPNRKSISDTMISLMKGMLLRGDHIHDVAACFGLNQGRAAEVSNSLTRPHEESEASLTSRARDITAASGGELPPRPPYPSPYEMMRAKAAMRASADSLRSMIEKANITLAMIDRVLQ